MSKLKYYAEKFDYILQLSIKTDIKIIEVMNWLKIINTTVSIINNYYNSKDHLNVDYNILKLCSD